MPTGETRHMTFDGLFVEGGGTLELERSQNPNVHKRKRKLIHFRHAD